MRIALAHPRLDYRGGAENFLCSMARGLTDRGHEVTVATRHFASDAWEPDAWRGIQVELLQKRRLDSLRTRAARKRGLGRNLRSLTEGCDLLVAQGAPATVWATVAASRDPALRVAWLCQEPRAWLHGRMTQPDLHRGVSDLARRPWLRPAAEALELEERRKQRDRIAIDQRMDVEAARRVDVILANSGFTAENVKRVYGLLSKPCWVGIPQPEPIVLPDTEPYVAWVTSRAPAKNADGFLEAMRIAVQELGAEDIRVRAVGLAGDDRIARRVADTGLARHVALLPRQSDEDLDALVAGGRLLACLPLDEPFGLMPIQAMARGRPVLASQRGGPSETVLDGITGLHADPLEPRDMAERLCELWRDPKRCDALGVAGRERYREHFTIEAFLDRFERFVRP